VSVAAFVFLHLTVPAEAHEVGCPSSQETDVTTMLALKQVVQQSQNSNGRSMGGTELSLSTHDIMNTTALGAFPEDCYATTHEYSWFGTAPWCSGHPGDCHARNMEFVGSCRDCVGSSCWSGTKVQCKRTIKRGVRDRCNPMCSSDFERYWVGTAPWCDGTECDCISSGGYPYKAAASAGGECDCEDRGACKAFGSGCHTGSKILCLKLKIHNTKYDDGLMAMKKECTERQRITEETRRAVISAIKDVAVAGIEAGASAGAAAAAGR